MLGIISFSKDFLIFMADLITRKMFLPYMYLSNSVGIRSHGTWMISWTYYVCTSSLYQIVYFHCKKASLTAGPVISYYLLWFLRLNFGFPYSYITYNLNLIHSTTLPLAHQYLKFLFFFSPKPTQDRGST